MRKIKSILCAMDIADPDQLVAEYTSAIAKQFGAKITVLYVAPHLAQYSRYAGIDAINEIHKELVEKSEAKMKDFITTAFTDESLKIKSAIVEGNAANEIVDYVKNNNIDVVVMGTRSKKGIERILLGSVASKVIKTSPVPVLTVNPKE